MALKRLRGMKFDQLYFRQHCDNGTPEGIWLPLRWEWGWKSSQMYESFHMGPLALVWCMA